MIALLSSWWRQRTPRELLALQALAIFVFLILLPFAAYSSASAFRTEAADALGDARKLKREAEGLAAQSRAEPLQSDGSVRGIATAAAERLGLAILRVEPLQQGRVRIAFAPANSVTIYRYLDVVTRRGLGIARSSITRVGESDEVSAEFDVVSGP